MDLLVDGEKSQQVLKKRKFFYIYSKKKRRYMKYLKLFEEYSNLDPKGSSSYSAVPEDLRTQLKQFVIDMIAGCDKEKSDGEGNSQFEFRLYNGDIRIAKLPSGYSAYVAKNGEMLFADDIESSNRVNAGSATLKIYPDAAKQWDAYLKQIGAKPAEKEMYAGYLRELCAEALEGTHDRKVQNVQYS